MTQRPRLATQRAALASTLAACAVLSACVVVPARGGYRGSYDGPAVMVAPPPVQAEVIGVAPAPGYFWIGGYWGWIGGRHSWIGGHWEAPRPGWRWAPHHWQHEGRGWREAPGRWERH